MLRYFSASVSAKITTFCYRGGSWRHDILHPVLSKQDTKQDTTLKSVTSVSWNVS